MMILIPNSFSLESGASTVNAWTFIMTKPLRGKVKYFFIGAKDLRDFWIREFWEEKRSNN